MNFSVRACDLVERIDEPDCDPALLHSTYRQFTRLNRLLGLSWWTYRACLRPHLQDPSRVYTLLDVGCGGGGQIADWLRWAARDGIRLRLTGIDPDARCIEYLNRQSWPEGLEFRFASAVDLAGASESFDFVTCNHVLHHLQDNEVRGFLGDLAALCRTCAVVTDAVRSPWTYHAFNLLARPFFRRSFIVEDGLMSIRRGFTPGELRRLVPDGWDVRSDGWFRLRLVYRPSSSGSGLYRPM